MASRRVAPGLRDRLLESARRMSPGSGILSNSAVLLVSRLLTAVVGIAIVPAIVSSAGLLGFGAWELVFAVASLAMLVNGSLNSTVLWRVSQAWGNEDRDSIRRVVRLGTTVALGATALLWPVAFIFRSSILVGLNTPSEFQPALEVALPLLAGLQLMGGINETLAATLGGAQRSGRATLTTSAGQIVNNLVALTMLLMGEPAVLSLATGAVVGFLTTFVGLYVAVQQRVGAVSLLPVFFTRAEIREWWSYGSLIFVGYISASLRDQTDKLVLGAFGSAAWVGAYSVAAKLGSLALEISRFFYVPVIAAIGAVQGPDRWERLSSMYTRLVAMISTGTVLMSVLVFSTHKQIITFWIGRPIAEATPLLGWILFGNTMAVTLTGPGSAMCRAVGRVGIETQYVIVGLVLNLTLTLTLVPLIGPIGSVIGSAVSWAAASCVFIWLFHRKLPVPRSSSLPALAALLAGGTALIAVVSAAGIPGARILTDASVLGLTAVSMLALGVYVSVGGLLWMSGAMLMRLHPRGAR